MAGFNFNFIKNITVTKTTFMIMIMIYANNDINNDKKITQPFY